MKHTIAVLILLLLSILVIAQDKAVKQTIPNDNTVVYPQLNRFLSAEKNRYRLLFSNNNQSDYKCFIELYNNLHRVHKGVKTNPVTFMNGPVIYSVTPFFETTKNANTFYQKNAYINTEPSTATTALQVLGVLGGIAAGAFKHSYIGQDEKRRYNIGSGAIDAYLETMSRQHDK